MAFLLPLLKFVAPLAASVIGSVITSKSSGNSTSAVAGRALGAGLQKQSGIATANRVNDTRQATKFKYDKKRMNYKKQLSRTADIKSASGGKWKYHKK